MTAVTGVAVSDLRDLAFLAAAGVGIPIAVRRWLLAERAGKREGEKHTREQDEARHARFAEARDKVLKTDYPATIEGAARIHALHDMVRIGWEDESGVLRSHAKDVVGRLVRSMEAWEESEEEKGGAIPQSDEEYLEEVAKDGESRSDFIWQAVRYDTELRGIQTTQSARDSEVQEAVDAEARKACEESVRGMLLWAGAVERKTPEEQEQEFANAGTLGVAPWSDYERRWLTEEQRKRVRVWMPVEPLWQAPRSHDEPARLVVYVSWNEEDTAGLQELWNAVQEERFRGRKKRKLGTLVARPLEVVFKSQTPPNRSSRRRERTKGAA